MELQADRTKIAPTGTSELAEPLCADHLRAAVRLASLQEIAETVSRALAYLTDRLMWPYCPPLMAIIYLENYDEIEEAHETYMRCAKRNTAKPTPSGLHDRLARLIEKSLRARDHTPRRMDHNLRGTGEIIPDKSGWQSLV